MRYGDEMRRDNSRERVTDEQGFSWVKMGLRCSKKKLRATRAQSVLPCHLTCYHFRNNGGYASGNNFASTLDSNRLTIVQAPWCYHVWFKDYLGLPLYIYMQSTEMNINRIYN